MERNPVNKLRRLRTERGVTQEAVRQDPSSANFYWLTESMRKPHRYLFLSDPRGYEVVVKSGEQVFIHNGSVSSRNESVKIKVTQPVTDGIRISTLIYRSFGHGKNRAINVQTQVDDLKRERIGDLSVDYLRRVPEGSAELVIENYCRDVAEGENVSPVQGISLTEENTRAIIENAYSVAFQAITKGEFGADLQVPSLVNAQQVVPSMVTKVVAF